MRRGITSSTLAITVVHILVACGGDPGQPLAIVEQPRSQTVTAPAAATFTVTAAAAEPLRYQWSRDDQAIADATGASYTIALTAPKDDSAIFTVTVSSGGDSIMSAPATLHVIAPTVDVKITRQPTDVSVTAGSAAALSVEATGTPPLSYQWYKDGYPIYGAAGATFSVAAAQASDAGAYAVTVTDATGQVASTPARLTVGAPSAGAPQIVHQPVGLIVTAGTAAILTVEATGDAPFAYQWSKDGAALAGATAPTLMIARAQAGDAGTYQVTVTNPAGTARSDTAALVVRQPPAIGEQPQGRSVVAGSPVTFTVTATGSPTLMYQWFKDGVGLAGETEPTLAIAAAAAADAGSYTVAVANGAGHVVSSAAVLTVTASLVPPAIVAGPQSVVVTEGAAASFTVTASGSAPLSYQWKKGQTAVAGATGPTLAFAATTLADTGIYSVVVKNAKGTTISDPATLMVTPKILPVPPAITGQPKGVEIFAGADARFTVTATGPAPTYQWHSAKKGAIAAATDATLTISAATLEDADDYWVVVTNPYGFATSDKATLTVDVVAAPPDARPADAPMPDAPSPVVDAGGSNVDALPVPTYTVTYNGNGNAFGSVPVDDTRHTQGQTVAALSNSGGLEKSGFAFAGWTTNPDTGGASASYAAGATWPMGAGDVTLYAVWIPTGLKFTSSGAAISITGTTSCPTGPFAVPPGVTAIASDGFRSCTALTSVSIPSSVTAIQSGTFLDCTALTSITVDSSNARFSSVDGSLLNKTQDTLVAAPCGLSSYAVPSGVTSIGPNAVLDCIVSDLTIPLSVVTIGVGAFAGCRQLKSVTIPSSVTSIGVRAFYLSGLTSITIPASVTLVDTAAFDECYALTGISVDPANSNYSSSQGVLFDKAQTTLLEAPGTISSFAIPASVTTIAEAAFRYCGALASISIPSTVTSIGRSAFNCAGLTSVTMQAAAPPSLGQYAFDCSPQPTYPIHVPSSAAVSAYDAAPEWSGYASRIVTP